MMLVDACFKKKSAGGFHTGMNFFRSTPWLNTEKLVGLHHRETGLFFGIFQN